MYGLDEFCLICGTLSTFAVRKIDRLYCTEVRIIMSYESLRVDGCIVKYRCDANGLPC